MAVETINPGMSGIVQLKNECGHKLATDRAVHAEFAMAQVLDETLS